MAYLSAEYFVTNETPKKVGNDHPILSPYGLFKTKDGNIAIAPANDKLCNVFLKTLKLELLGMSTFHLIDLWSIINIQITP